MSRPCLGSGHLIAQQADRLETDYASITRNCPLHCILYFPLQFIFEVMKLSVLFNFCGFLTLDSPIIFSILNEMRFLLLLFDFFAVTILFHRDIFSWSCELSYSCVESAFSKEKTLTKRNIIWHLREAFKNPKKMKHLLHSGLTPPTHIVSL